MMNMNKIWHNNNVLAQRFSGTVTFVLSCILGVFFSFLFSQFDKSLWGHGSLLSYGGLYLSYLFGGGWINGFVLVAGLILGIAVGIIVKRVEKTFSVKIILNTVGIVASLSATSVIGFVTGGFAPSFFQLFGLQIALFVWLIFPFAAGCCVAFLCISAADGILGVLLQ